MYYTAGFPSLNDTSVIAESLANAGADIIEIGIPYSDPVADGPTETVHEPSVDPTVNIAECPRTGPDRPVPHRLRRTG